MNSTEQQLKPPKDLVAMAARAFAPFTRDDTERLRGYRALVADLERRSLAAVESLTWTVEHGFKDVSEDSLLALSLPVRKLGFLQKEPANFARVRALLKRRAVESGTPEGKTVADWLDQVEGIRRGFLDSSRVGRRMRVEDDSGALLQELTPADVVDLYVNGAGFHTDPVSKKRWDALNGFDSKGLMTILTVTLWDLLSVFRALDTLIATIVLAPRETTQQPRLE